MLFTLLSIRRIISQCLQRGSALHLNFRHVPHTNRLVIIRKWRTLPARPADCTYSNQLRESVRRLHLLENIIRPPRCKSLTMTPRARERLHSLIFQRSSGGCVGAGLRLGGEFVANKCIYAKAEYEVLRASERGGVMIYSAR